MQQLVYFTFLRSLQNYISPLSKVNIIELLEENYLHAGFLQTNQQCRNNERSSFRLRIIILLSCKFILVTTPESRQKVTILSDLSV